ncbi:MAG: hypothetical protein F9K41_00520 [Sphingopyxis terrae]|nr:MAG: hypothetical protein F9K41_00520 [Sphingopyxis terrae]
MSDLHQQLADAEALAERLRRQIAAGPCAETGHDWQSDGGCNAMCDLGDHCTCSVPVHDCAKCGDCDYGENPEADRIREACRGHACTCQGGYHQREGAALRADDCPIHGLEDFIEDDADG